MKKTKKFSLLCLSALFLASCANGGTSSPTSLPSSSGTSSQVGTSSPSTPAPNPDPTPDSSSTPSIPGSSSTPDSSSTPSSPDSSSTPDSTPTQPAQTFTITLVAGTNGTLTQTVATVTLNEAFTLPAPTPNTNFVFRGWEYNGNLITNADGQGLDVWSIEQDVEVTARYAAVYHLQFKFTTQVNVNTQPKTYYADEDLQDTFEITENLEPSMVAPVWGWYSDASATPDKRVTSFSDLTEIDSNNNATLYSKRTDEFDASNFENGFLISTDRNKTSRLTTLDLSRLYMLGKNVTGIRANAFANKSTLQTIYIPKSVSSIELGALSSISSLTTINIQIPENQKPEEWRDNWDPNKIKVNWNQPIPELG